MRVYPRWPHGARSVAALVLENQFEPHRVTVAIHPRLGELIHFDTLAGVRPQTDVAKVVAPATDGPAGEAIAAVQRADVEVALKCSAAAF